MKLTYRDKVIFLTVVAIIVLVLGFVIFIKPKYVESTQTKQQVIETRERKQEVQDKIDTLEEREKQLMDLVDEVREYEELYFDEQETYQVDQFVFPLADEAGFKMKSVELEQPTAEEFAKYAYAENIVAYPLLEYSDINNELPENVINALKGQKPTKPVGQKIYLVAMEMVAEIDDEEASVDDFLDSIEDQELTILCTKIELEEKATDAEGEVLEGVNDVRFRFMVYCSAPMAEVEID